MLLFGERASGIFAVSYNEPAELETAAHVLRQLQLGRAADPGCRCKRLIIRAPVCIFFLHYWRTLQDRVPHRIQRQL